MESYFDRVRPRGSDLGPEIQFVDLIHPHSPHLPVDDAARYVWDYMKIKAKFYDEAEDWGIGDFAAVHFRGSDKRLEATPVTPSEVIAKVQSEMTRRTLGKVFVASDEPSFIEAAKAHFGSAAFVVPQSAVAKEGVPPHMQELDGEVVATEALVTMLVMARAQVLVRTASYMSEWAHTLSGEQDEVIVLAV